MSMNMAKRAAAGAMKTSAWSEDETHTPFHATDHIPISWRNKQRGSNRTVALTRDPGRVFAMALSIFVALSFVSYAAYVHQWSELSAMRHLGKASEPNSYK
jgi:hypothetical protein